MSYHLQQDWCTQNVCHASCHRKQENYTWFQAAAAKFMRSALFRDITKRIAVILSEFSGQHDGTNSLFRGVGKELPLYAA